MGDKSRQNNPISFLEKVDKKAWKEKVTEDLKERAYESIRWKDKEGLIWEPILTEEDRKAFDYIRASDNSRSMVEDSNWEARHWFNMAIVDVKPGVQAAHDLALKDLQHAATGIHFENLPSSLDMHALLHGIDPKYCALGFALESYKSHEALIAWLKKQEHAVHGYVLYDPLVARGTGREKSLGSTLKAWFQAWKEIPLGQEHFSCFAVDAGSLAEAGAFPAQELGMALSITHAQYKAARACGIDQEVFFKRLIWHLSAGPGYFKEIAKIKAARVLLLKFMQAQELRVKVRVPILSQVAQWNKTLLDEHNNLVRSCLEAQSAVVGGCDYLISRPFSLGEKSTSSFARRISQNLSPLFHEEAYLGKNLDPAAGAYYLDHLTDGLARQAWKVFQDIERKGGFEAYMDAGDLKKQFASNQQLLRDRLADRRDRLIGVNIYANLSADPIGELLKEGNTAPEGEIQAFRVAKDFEAIRNKVRIFTNQQKKSGLELLGHPIFLEDKKASLQRFQFASEVLSCAGLACDVPGPYNNLKDAANEAAQSGAPFLLICGSDLNYQNQVSPLVKTIREKKYTGPIVLAGNPKLGDYPVDHFVYLRMNLIRFFKEILANLGLSI